MSKAILGSLCGGIGGFLIGIVISGYLSMLSSIDRAPNGPEGTPFAPILGLFEFFFGIVFGLFFAAIGGVVGAVVGAGLAAMSRDEPSVEKDTARSREQAHGPNPTIAALKAQESPETELALLKEKIAEIETRIAEQSASQSNRKND